MGSTIATPAPGPGSDGPLSACAPEGPAANLNRNTRWLAIWLLAVGQTMGWAALYYLFPALLFRWEQALGWSKADLTLGLTGAVLVSAAVAPAAGRIIDRGRGRWLLPLAMLGGAIALTGLAAVPNADAFLAVWLAIGLAQGACLYEPCFAFVTRTAGSFARGGITRISLVAGFASTIAFPAGAWLSDAYGWRTAVLVFAASLACVGAPLTYVGARLLECCPGGGHAEAHARNRAAVRSSIRTTAFWLVLGAFALIALTDGLVLTHIVPILIDRGLAETTAVAAATLFGPMQVLGRVMILGTDRRLSATALSLFAFGGAALACGFLLWAGGNPWVAYLFAALFGISFGLTTILKPLVTAEALGREGFGAIAGWLAVPALACLALSPHLGSLLWGVGGYDLAIWAGLGAALLGTACILCLSAVTSPSAGSRT